MVKRIIFWTFFFWCHLAYYAVCWCCCLDGCFSCCHCCHGCIWSWACSFLAILWISEPIYWYRYGNSGQQHSLAQQSKGFDCIVQSALQRACVCCYSDNSFIVIVVVFFVGSFCTHFYYKSTHNADMGRHESHKLARAHTHTFASDRTAVLFPVLAHTHTHSHTCCEHLHGVHTDDCNRTCTGVTHLPKPSKSSLHVYSLYVCTACVFVTCIANYAYRTFISTISFFFVLLLFPSYANHVWLKRLLCWFLCVPAFECGQVHFQLVLWQQIFGAVRLAHSLSM